MSFPYSGGTGFMSCPAWKWSLMGGLAYHLLHNDNCTWWTIAVHYTTSTECSVGDGANLIRSSKSQRSVIHDSDLHFKKRTECLVIMGSMNPSSAKLRTYLPRTKSLQHPRPILHLWWWHDRLGQMVCVVCKHKGAIMRFRTTIDGYDAITYMRTAIKRTPSMYLDAKAPTGKEKETINVGKERSKWPPKFQCIKMSNTCLERHTTKVWLTDWIQGSSGR